MSTSTGTTQPLIGVSLSISRRAKPDRSQFTTGAYGFQDADGAWFVREPLSGEVVPATLVGTTLTRAGVLRVEESDVRTSLDDQARRLRNLEQVVSLLLGRDIKEVFPN